MKMFAMVAIALIVSCGSAPVPGVGVVETEQDADDEVSENSYTPPPSPMEGSWLNEDGCDKYLTLSGGEFEWVVACKVTSDLTEVEVHTGKYTHSDGTVTLKFSRSSCVGLRDTLVFLFAAQYDETEDSVFFGGDVYHANPDGRGSLQAVIGCYVNGEFVENSVQRIVR